jgi:Carboxypeptidase regulatory-like domain
VAPDPFGRKAGAMFSGMREARMRVIRRWLTGYMALGVLMVIGPRPAAAVVAAMGPAPATGDLTGSVADSANGGPLQGADIVVSRGGAVVATVETDQFGRFIVHDLPTGEYSVQAQLIGFGPQTRQVSVGGGGQAAMVRFRLASIPINLQALTVTALAPVAVDTRTGEQVFQQNDYHGAPSTTTSQILQQSIVGAARAPTGEVHIRGQHAEYTYYIDGVPVPSGISGSLNELFDPKVVNRIDFQTGGWDAEYGNKNAAIINVQTRIPSGPFRADASGYVGSYSSNGESLNASSNPGKWGWFVSGTRQQTGMRQEPVVYDTANDKAINFHNDGHDYFAFGKVQFLPSPGDAVNLDVNWSRTGFQVPFDSTEGVINDNQRDINSFANLSWRHQFGAPGAATEDQESDLFAAAYYRHGSLKYTPGANDEPSFIFYPNPTPYNVQENRSFNSVGTKIDYHWRPSHAAEFKTGIQASTTTGHETFLTTDAAGAGGPASVSNLNGHDAALYAETGLTPVEWFELRAGVRYDQHVAPFAGTQDQVSPRIKLTFFPSPATTFYLYYGRLFMPTNIEDLRAITQISEQGDTTSTSPTLPERDNFFEATLVHRFPYGIVTKLSGYVKHSSPGIDDNTVPGTSIVTDVNIATVHITGLESAIEIRPPGPLSGYLNFAINHAYGRGPVTGGFFPTDVADVPGGWFDLDHDQRISAVASAVYSAARSFVSMTGIYGSGLTNGADITHPIGTGLFDFNSDIHVNPSFILNGAVGHTLVLGRGVADVQLYVNNIFDLHYLLKGAFFSGASVGRPRTFELRVSLGR